MSKMYGKGKTAIESEEQAKLRWQVELEFVQCLANPNYLNFLAQRGYFKDQAFINYLKYLQYWKEPDYAKYLMYPMCLYFLDLLQYEHFRREIVNAQCCKFIDDQAILQWQHYTRKRIKMFNSVASNGARDGSGGGMPMIGSENAAGGDSHQQQGQQQHAQQPTAALQNAQQGAMQNGIGGGPAQQQLHAAGGGGQGQNAGGGQGLQQQDGGIYA